MRVVTQSETKYGISLYVTKPSLKYIDELLRMNCASDLLEWKLFPNAKEITESMAAVAAMRAHLWRYGYSPSDKEVTLISVEDGSTPRTAALFAVRTAWQCIAIDPRLRTKPDWNSIDRLTIYSQPIEECHFITNGPVVLVGVHSHANLRASVQAITSPRLAIVAIPCCVPLTLDTEPDVMYSDYGIASPERTVKVWTDVRRKA